MRASRLLIILLIIMDRPTPRLTMAPQVITRPIPIIPITAPITGDPAGSHPPHGGGGP